jgi:hypothetical protein
LINLSAARHHQHFLLFGESKKKGAVAVSASVDSAAAASDPESQLKGEGKKPIRLFVTGGGGKRGKQI